MWGGGLRYLVLEDQSLLSRLLEADEQRRRRCD